MFTTTITTLGNMTQIAVKHPEHSGEVVMTHFKGEKTWSVVGHEENGDKHTCYNGENPKFQKRNAIKMAIIWLQKRRTFL